MSFRLKTIIGIAFIEALLLMLLVWNSLEFLTGSNEDSMLENATLTSVLFAAMTTDAVLSSDFAKLNEAIDKLLTEKDIVYARIRSTDQILAQGGSEEALSTPYSKGITKLAGQEILNVNAQIQSLNRNYGSVEIGISVQHMKDLVDKARNQLYSIAALEMVLVALFSYMLGSYLTRGLDQLAEAANAITKGKLGTQVEVKGKDELAIAAKSFNTMSAKLEISQKEVSRVVGKSLDLSEKLKQSELRLRTILDNAVDAVVSLDNKGIITSINMPGASTFGYKAHELLGRSVTRLLPCFYTYNNVGDIDDGSVDVLENMVCSGREGIGLHKDGTEIPIDWSLSRMTLGEERMFVGLIRNISDRKAIAATAKRSETIKSAIVEASLDALITINESGEIVDFSYQAELMFGHARETVLGQSMAEIVIPPALRESHNDGMKDYLATGHAPIIGKRIEVPALRADGNEFPAELIIAEIDVEGEKLFAGFIRDISILKSSQTELEDAKVRAEAASDAKSRFLAHMSHEIRSPLNAVIGSIDLLLDNDLSEEQRLYAQTANTSGKALLGVINDILDFSKIEAGQLNLDRVKFNLRDLVAGVGEVVAYRATGKNVEVASFLGSNIPKTLVGDPSRLRQILLNLMDNAVKFTEQGSVTLKVTAAARDKKSVGLRIEIEDTGIGIPEKEQERLFDEFIQVDGSDSTRFGGTGLGLAISKELIELMGGIMGVDSTLGKGSCFWIELLLPCVLDEAADLVFEKFDHRVLVVGLSPKVRELVRQQCEVLGCSAESTSSGKAALEQLSRDRGYSYDYVFVDEGIRDIDVSMFAQRAHAIDAGKLILVSSSNLLDGSLPKTVQGYDRVILKPIHLDSLLGALSESSSNTIAHLAPGNESTTSAADYRSAKKLLLVEDSRANQMVATALLRKAGFSVDVAENGREGVEAYKTGIYDLILMDLRMPEMNGIEATQAIRADGEDGRAVIIIAMTANALQTDIDRCLDAGMNDYVTKPIDRDNLFTVLDGWLGDELDVKIQSHLKEIEENNVLKDETAITRLARDTSPDAVPTMVAMFIEESSQRVARINDGLTRLSLESLEDELHTIKSLAGTFGAVKLHALVKEMETACREGERKLVNRLGAELFKVHKETIAVYQDASTSPA